MKSTVSKALRNIIAERDSYTCVLCENGYTDMHHVTPRSQGGRNNPYNLVAICRSCHMQLHRELPLAERWRKYGWKDLEDWIEESEHRMFEYLAHFYAFDDDYAPIDHDSFSIYHKSHHPLDNAPAVSWDKVKDRFVGQYWDKDKQKWVTIYTENTED